MRRTPVPPIASPQVMRRSPSAVTAGYMMWVSDGHECFQSRRNALTGMLCVSIVRLFSTLHRLGTISIANVLDGLGPLAEATRMQKQSRQHSTRRVTSAANLTRSAIWGMKFRD